MKICVLGHTGFVGQTVYSFLQTKYQVFGISRSSAPKILPSSIDVIVNCAGSSSKYQAEKYPNIDFSTTVGVIKVLMQLPEPKKLIHISSIDCSNRKGNYEFTRWLSEKIVSQYFTNYTILRLPAIVGQGLKKNLVYDLLHGKKVWVSSDSWFNIITSQFIAEVVEKCISKIKTPPLIKVVANKAISVENIFSILRCEKPKSWGLVRQDYRGIKPSSFVKSLTKSSEEFLEDFRKDIGG